MTAARSKESDRESEQRIALFARLLAHGVDHKIYVKIGEAWRFIPIEIYFGHLSNDDLEDILATGRLLFAQLAVHGGRCETGKIRRLCRQQHIQFVDEFGNEILDGTIALDGGQNCAELVPDKKRDGSFGSRVGDEQGLGQSQDHAALKGEGDTNLARKPALARHPKPPSPKTSKRRRG